MPTAIHDEHQPESKPASHRGFASAGPAALAAKVVSRSGVLQRTLEALYALAISRVPALLIGEPGTGKRFFARMLQRTNAAAPFVRFDCAGALLSSDSLRRAFREAQGGTLVLGDIDRLDLTLQDELLVLAQRDDVRLVALAESPLHHDVDEGRVRPALLALFASSTVRIPPLRERHEDVPELVQHFFDAHVKRTRRVDLRGVSPEASALLEQNAFADNVRGLEQAVQQAVEFAEGPYVTAMDLPEEIRRVNLSPLPLLLGTLPAHGLDLPAAVEEFETRMILQALERTGWNKNRAARLLGLNRTTLVEMIKRKRLAPPALARKTLTLAPDPTSSEAEQIAAE